MSLIKRIATNLLLLLSSCITSVHPIVTTDTIAQDKRLPGTWLNEEQTTYTIKFNTPGATPEKQKSNNTAQKVTQHNDENLLLSQSYNCTYNKAGITYSFAMSLVALNGQTFADISAENAEQNAPLPQLFDNKVFPTHTIARLSFTSPQTIQLQFLDEHFLQSALNNKQISLRHEQDALFGPTVITASTDEMQRFLTKYGTDQRLYSSENTLTLTRKS